MNAHPAASLFPLMDGNDLNALVEDIRAHGLHEPIVMLDGLVLDGRNRLRACELAGVQPHFVEWHQDGSSPTEYVVSLNLHRRHLTTAQRAALALDILPRLEDEAHERQVAGLRQGDSVPVSPETDERGRADEKAADLVGVSRTTVATTKAIQQRDPEDGLTHLLVVVRDAWGDDKKGTSAPILHGVCDVASEQNGGFQRAKLTGAFKKTTPALLLRKAEELHFDIGGTKRQNIRRALKVLAKV